MQKGRLLLGRYASSWVCESCSMRLARSQKLTSQATRAFSISHTRAAPSKRRSQVPSKPARTRFAPSPTGNLHLGSIRTALFNYLLAKRTGGQFLLRIEDTDQKRTVPGAEERLFKDLRWAGLHWDEGPEVGGPYGPYRQSERLPLYHEHVKILLAEKKAYRCFCSSERIDKLNRLRYEKGLPLGYDRKCIDIDPGEADVRAAKGESNVIRFQVPKYYPKYDDLVYGKSGHGNAKTMHYLADEPVFDDPILIKSDKFPTYHFANVVDDQLMKVTHVIRGSEWMSSTPLHVALYQAFGWESPLYGHVPLLVDSNRQKLSKRNLDSDISSFRDKQGIFPETLTNFTALLGWSHQKKSDIMDLEELAKTFDLHITKGNTMVKFEKLHFLQEQHARKRIEAGGEPFEQMIRDVAVRLLERHGAGVLTNFIRKRKLRDVVAEMLQVPSLPYRNSHQFAESLDMFLTNRAIKERQPLQELVPDVTLYPDLRVAMSTLFFIPEEHWKRDVLRHHLSSMNLGGASSEGEEQPPQVDAKIMRKGLYSMLRWAILGVTGPDVPTLMEILGREVCEVRLRDAIHLARETENESTKVVVQPRRVPKGEGNSRWESHTLPQSAPT